MTGRLLLILALLLSAALGAAAEPPASGERATAGQIEFFEKQVRPLLAENCWKCHGPDEQKGGLRLDSRGGVLTGGDTGAAIVPGRPDESELILAVRYDPDGYQMPPTGKLPQEAIDVLVEWVRIGAPWPEEHAAGGAAGDEFDIVQRARHWSFQPVVRPAVPPVTDAAWPSSPIDAFILLRLEEAGLHPSPPSDRRTWLRRVSFDLVGLPPRPEETADFLADDSPAAEHKAVDRLLASAHHGERWGRHWLDLVRFAETAGHEFDYDIPYAWRYRDYVVRALNADLPFDRFVVEHVAGDLVADPRRHASEGWNESLLATAFWWFSQGKHSPVDLRAEECDRAENQIDVLGKAFLGLTIACARCHDHKFDPVSTADYYALAGYLRSTRQQIAFVDDEPVAAAGRELEELKSAQRRVLADAAAAALAPDGATRGDGSFADRLTEALDSRAARDAAHPLHAWAVLGKHTDAAAFAAARRELAERLSRRAGETAVSEGVDPEGVEVFDDFAGERYTKWYASGTAFGSGPSVAGDFVLGGAGDAGRRVRRGSRAGRGSPDPAAPADRRSPEASGDPSPQPRPVYDVLPAGQAHSGRLSPRFLGVLRSETFTITRPFIDYRVRRVGGRSSPGTKHKNGQVHLIVDGFHLIQNPLYGGLTINTANDGEFRWYRQDVSKLLGSRAYIEIEDEEPDGSIVVDRIVFSDGPRAAFPGGAWERGAWGRDAVLAWLGNPQIDSPAALAEQYERAIAETVDVWRDGRLATAEGAADRVALLNAVLPALVPSEAAREPREAGEASWPLARFVREYRAAESRIPTPRRTIAAVDGSGENEHVLIRGNHRRPGPEVPRRFLEVFAGSEAGSSGLDPQLSTSNSGRLELARRIADPENPLAGRVLVNRLWQHHFGRGIVPSVDNFGVLGEPPSHPELLDWLAAEFADSFSQKRLHRAMALSATYRMSSGLGDARAEAADPQNRLWHRMPVRRLEAESVRDAMLAVSGRLDRRMEGESVLPYLTPFMEGRGRPAASGPLDGAGRRSLYISVRRNFLTPLFLAFDYPTPLSTMGRRGTSNVPAQALALMNNPFVIEQAEVWARQTLAAAGADAADEAIVRRLYEHAFTRPPSAGETAAAIEFVHGGAPDRRDLGRWAEFCHVLLNTKEFVFVP